MTATRWPRICRVCHKKRRLNAVTLMCGECSGDDWTPHVWDESPTVLDPAGWVNDRGIMRHRDGRPS